MSHPRRGPDQNRKVSSENVSYDTVTKVTHNENRAYAPKM